MGIIAAIQETKQTTIVSQRSIDTIHAAIQDSIDSENRKEFFIEAPFG